MDKAFCLTYFHGSTFFDKRRLNLVPQVIDFKREVKLRSSWLYRVLLAERHPFPSKICCLNQRLKRKHRCTIIRYIARDLIHRIIKGQDRKNGVCSDQRRLLQRIYCTDKEIHSCKLWWLAFSFESAQMFETRYRRYFDLPCRLSNCERFVTLRINGRCKFLCW